MRELDERKSQVQKLGVMLEALEPVPGVDAERLLEVIEGAPTEIDHDPRDMKIVHLSKKTRQLTVGIGLRLGLGS